MVSLLRRDGTSEALLEAACGALETMCEVEENHEAAWEAQSISSLVNVLRHGGTDKLLKSACGALVDLFSSDQHDSAAREVGAISAVVHFLRKDSA